MGSGASTTAGALPWPAGYRVAVYPGATLPEGFQIGAPVAGSEKGVGFWRLGGPGKARLRVLEDPNGLVELKESFTVGVCFRAGAGSTAGWDSILLGHDNKHWLAMPGDDKTKLCCLNVDKSNELSADFLQGWVQVFLRPIEGGTSVLAVDAEGLLDLGTFPTSLVGSKLRSAGWAGNELDVAGIAVWDRSLSWGELQKALSPPAPAPPDVLERQIPKILGQVTDLKGNPLGNVSIKWKATGCLSDEDGQFQLEDDETDVPETASQASGSSSWSCLSFECEGFAPTMVRASSAADQSVNVVLRPLSASAVFDGSAGGCVEDPLTGSSVTVPSNALSYADGRPVTGPVTVNLSVIDVTDPKSLASMPGDFSAIGADGAEVMLESLGAAWINATDEKGEELEVREDSEVILDLHTEAKANAEKLGATPEMWSFDTASGKWKLEAADMEIDGVPAENSMRRTAREVEIKESVPATRRPRKSKKRVKKDMDESLDFDPEKVSASWITPEQFMKILAKEGEKSLAAPVKKLGYWNVDMAYSSPNKAVLLQGTVVDANQKAMPDVQIWAVGKDYYGQSPDKTAADGRFSALMVQFDSTVDVQVQYQTPAETDKKMDVFYAGGKLPEHEASMGKALRNVPGRYIKSETEMKWTKGSASIEWDEKRRRWNHSVADRVLFCLPCDEAIEAVETTPAAEGWRATSQTNLPAPCYRRSQLVTTETFGPFSTGPPGNFVDIGELCVRRA